MTFSSPLFLWFLPAALGPLILHFLHRRKPQALAFASLDLIKLAHRSRMPKRRLRDLILLILRTLLILFFVLLFSRPVLRQAGALSGGGKSKLVILMDVSASMDATYAGRTRLETAKEEARRLLRLTPADAEVGLVTFTDRVETEIAPSGDRTRVVGALSAAKPVYRPSNILPALKGSAPMLSGAEKRTAVILSDQAQNVWRAATPAAGSWEGFDPGVRYIVRQCGDPPKSRAITAASLELSEEGALRGHLSVFSNNGAPPALWNAELNGRTVAKGQAGGGTQDEPFEAQLPTGGYYAGSVSLTHDEMPFDDAFYIAGRVPKGYRLLLVDGDPGNAPADSEVYYLRSALESPRDPRLESIDTVTPDGFGSVTLSNYDAIVVANAPDVAGREADLRQWVESGGGLLIAPGARWAKNRSFILQLFPSGGVKTGAEHPAPPKAQGLLSGIAGLDRFDWGQITANTRILPEAGASYETLIAFQNGDPLLLQQMVGKGNLLVLTTSMDRAWTNLPAKPAFAPLMREAVAALADPFREQTSLQAYVDEPARFKLPEGTRSVTVVAPDGGASGAGIDREGRLEWVPPPLPGLYEIRTDKPENWFKAAVNMRDIPAEADTRLVRETDVRAALPGAGVAFVPYQAGDRGLENAVEGRDVTTILLVLIGLLLFVETAMAFSRRAVLAALLVALLPVVSPAGAGNRFVFGQLKHAGAWDPYPGVTARIFETIHGMTNIPTESDRRVVTLTDPALYETPFLLVKGSEALQFSQEEKTRLRRYIDRGGFVFFDDTLADARGPFAASVRGLMAELYPGKTFGKLPMDHALFRSFFLIRSVAGRRIADRQLEGLEVGGSTGGGQGRTAVVYCPNDVIGAWMRDNLGQYAYPCEPGGEAQRWESFKLTINVIYFSLTGTYKKDAIHQPFIEMKLGS